MKKLILLFCIISCISCKTREPKIYEEKTYVVTHKTGIDTLKASSVYIYRLNCIFYDTDCLGNIVGKFDAPYSIKIIK